MQPPPSQVGPEEARDMADQVLSGRAYVEAARPPTLQERLFDWIAEQISDLFGALSTSGGRGIVSWLIIGTFAVFIVFLLTRLFRNVGALPVRSGDRDPVIDLINDRSADEWLAAAAEAEAAGDWRTGVRCRHRALVATLVRRGIVAARPGQTAGEIERVVSANHADIAEPMREATWLFKDTWYGWIEATPQSSQRFSVLAEQVLASELVSS